MTMLLIIIIVLLFFIAFPGIKQVLGYIFLVLLILVAIGHFSQHDEKPATLSGSTVTTVTGGF